METATEWAPLELKAGEVRWMLHAPIRVAPSIRIVPSWPIATGDALTANRRFRGIADMTDFHR